MRAGFMSTARVVTAKVEGMLIETPPEPKQQLSENNSGFTLSLQAKTATVVLTASALLVVLYVLWITRTLLLLIFAGALLALMLRSGSAWIEQRLHVGRRWSLPLVVIFAVAVLSFGIWLRGPAIEVQIDQLQEKLPQAARVLVARVNSQGWGQWLVAHGVGVEQLPRAMDVLPRVTGVLSSTAGFLAGIMIILFLGIAMAAEPETYYKGVVRLFRPRARAYASYVAAEIARALRWWLVARFVSMSAVGAMAFLGLWMLGIPLAGTLGVLAALLAFIPNVGPFLSVIPPVLLAFGDGPRQVIFVIALFCAIHAIEGFFVTPIAERAAVQLPPALTFSAQMLLAIVAGPVGFALAAPLTTVAMVLVRTVYMQKVIEE